MTQKNEDGINAFQTFSTLLALLLPILQFFFGFLPQSAQSVFIIEQILLPVSIIAALFSYLLIIAFKNTTWFRIPFNKKKHKEYQDFQNEINYLRSYEDEVKREQKAKQLVRNPKSEPFYLTPLNVYVVLLPLLLFNMLLFLGIGIFGNTDSKLLVLIQSVAYIFSISLASLTLAVFYINETNRKNQQQLNRYKYQKILQLLYDNNSLPEFPNIEFLAQNDTDFTLLKTYIQVNNKAIYEVTTDNNGDILKQVLRQNNTEDQEGLKNDQS